MDGMIKYLVEKPRRAERNSYLISLLTVILVSYFFVTLFLQYSRLGIPHEEDQVPNALALYAAATNSVTFDPRVLASEGGALHCSGVTVGEVQYTDVHIGAGRIYTCDSRGVCRFDDALSLDSTSGHAVVKNLRVRQLSVRGKGRAVRSTNRPLYFDDSPVEGAILKLRGDRLEARDPAENYVTCDDLPPDVLPVFGNSSKGGRLVSSNLYVDRTLIKTCRPFSLLYSDEDNRIVPLEMPQDSLREAFHLLLGSRDGLKWHAFPKFYEMDVGPSNHVLVKKVDGGYSWESRTFGYHGNVVFPETSDLLKDKIADGLVVFDGNHKTLKTLPVASVTGTDETVPFGSFRYLAQLTDSEGTLTVAPRIMPPTDSNYGVLTHVANTGFGIDRIKITSDGLIDSKNSYTVLDSGVRLEACGEMLTVNDMDLRGRRLISLGKATAEKDVVSLAYAREKRYLCRTAGDVFDALGLPITRVLGPPNHDHQLVNYWYFRDMVGLCEDGVDTFKANDKRIRGLPSPVDPTSLANKEYVDTQTQTVTLQFTANDDSYTTHRKSFRYARGDTVYKFANDNGHIMRIHSLHYGQSDGRSEPAKIVVSVQDSDGVVLQSDNINGNVSKDVSWNFESNYQITVKLDSDFVEGTTYFLHVLWLVNS